MKEKKKNKKEIECFQPHKIQKIFFDEAKDFRLLRSDEIRRLTKKYYWQQTKRLIENLRLTNLKN